MLCGCLVNDNYLRLFVGIIYVYLYCKLLEEKNSGPSAFDFELQKVAF